MGGDATVFRLHIYGYTLYIPEHVLEVPAFPFFTWLPNARNPAAAPSPTTFLNCVFFN